MRQHCDDASADQAVGLDCAPGVAAARHSSHDHAVRAGADQRYLGIALGLIVAFMLVEVVVAVTSGSLALLADAGHMLTDAGALAGAIWAARLAARPAQGAWTFGLKRAEILSAAVNGVTLLAVALLIGNEAIDRLLHPVPVEGAAMLAVAGVGIVVNVAASLVLARANRSSLNIEGAFQHILTDAFAFIATLVAGLVIVVTGLERADPIASLIVVALMLRASWKLLRASGRVLLEGAPDHVDVTSDLPALSAHVVVEDDAFRDGHAPVILDRLQRCIAEHFDVEHSSFQLEPARHEEHEAAVHKS